MARWILGALSAISALTAKLLTAEDAEVSLSSLSNAGEEFFFDSSF